MDMMDPIQPTSNIPLQSVQQPFTPSPPKTTYKLFFVIGGLVILFIGLLGGYYLTKSGSKPPVKSCTLEAKICPDGSGVVRTGPNCEFSPCSQITTTPTPTPILINESSQSATANWKTYTNKKYLISFKYPDDYFKYISPSEDTVYLAPRAGNGEAYGSPMGLEQKDIWLSLSVNPNDSGISLEQFMNLPEMSDYKNAKKQKTTIANKIAYKVTVDKPSGSQGVVYYEGLIENGKNIYRIQLSSFTIESLNTKQIIFDQILSTFKFTDQSQTITPNPYPTLTSDEQTKWEQYTNTNFGISFKFPKIYDNNRNLEVSTVGQDTTALKSDQELWVAFPQSDVVLLFIYKYTSDLSAKTWWESVGIDKYTKLVKDFYDAVTPQESIFQPPRFAETISTLDGKETVVAKGYINAAQRGDSIITVISNKGQIYVLEQLNQLPNNEAVNKSNKILSTFKFL